MPRNLETRRRVHSVIVTASAIYLAILASTVFVFVSPLWGLRINAPALIAMGLILLECVILSVLCITSDRRHASAGWISLATAAFLWILGVHFWVTLYALLPASRSALLARSLLVIGNLCAILTWVASAVLGARSTGAIAGRSAPGLIAVVTAAFGVLAALMGLSSGL